MRRAGKRSIRWGKAIVTILIADLVMSTDNVIAVAGACKGNMTLLVFGLGSSIPLVVFGATCFRGSWTDIRSSLR